MGSAEAIMHDADMKYDWCCVYWSGNSNHKICHCRRHFIKILHYFAKIIQQQKRQVPNTLHSTHWWWCIVTPGCIVWGGSLTCIPHRTLRHARAFTALRVRFPPMQIIVYARFDDINRNTQRAVVAAKKYN